MSLSQKVEGIVLKRTNLNEADRLVTIFTKELGKITALAKGVRKINSKKRGGLEPVSHGYYYLITYHDRYLITQVQIINSFAAISQNLIRITQATQILEIINCITVENQETPEIFDTIINTLDHLKENGQHKTLLLKSLNQIIHILGFSDSPQLSEKNLQNLLEEVLSKPLKTKRFLTIPKLIIPG